MKMSEKMDTKSWVLFGYRMGTDEKKRGLQYPNETRH